MNLVLPTLWLLAFAHLCPEPCLAQAAGSVNFEGTEPLRVGLLASDNFPFSQPAQGPTPDNHAGLEGFEVDLMDAVCEAAELNCTAVPLYSLEDRIALLAKGSLDFTASALSFTPGREAVVHFVRPFYYSSGVALFGDTSRTGLALFGPGPQSAKALESAAGWRGVFTGNFPVGQTLCFVEGYYALPFILQDVEINIKVVPRLQDAADSVRDGSCAALAYDSVAPESLVGLPMLNAQPAYMTPYGIAINKADAGTELEQKLVYALVGLMNQNNASRILDLERQWLVPNGVGPSSKLNGVVDAISTFATPLSAGPGQVPESYSLFGMRPTGRKLL